MSEEIKKYPIDGLLAEISAAAKRKDRGFLAELRSGLNENTQEKAWPIIAGHCRRFTDSAERKIWLTVGGLVALLAPAGLNVATWSSIGTVMRKIKDGDPNKGENAVKSYEAKFRRILNCHDSDELCDVIINVVRMAERKGVGVNCGQLFWDLQKWNVESKREDVRVKWTSDFYGVFEKRENADDNQPEEEA